MTVGMMPEESTESESTDDSGNGMELVGVRLPEYMYEVVEALAEEQGESKSAVVRGIVKDDLRERNYLEAVDEQVKERLRADGSGD